MVCLYCGAKTHVINSRSQKRNNQVWRRRQCLKCRAIFTTEETVQYEAVWLVQASKGRLEPFSSNKLMLSLYQACGHRQTALKDAAALTDTVITRLGSEVENGRIWIGTITQIAQVTLNRFDKAASVYYQARYKS